MAWFGCTSINKSVLVGVVLVVIVNAIYPERVYSLGAGSFTMPPAASRYKLFDALACSFGEHKWCMGCLKVMVVNMAILLMVLSHASVLCRVGGLNTIRTSSASSRLYRMLYSISGEWNF